MEDKAKFAVKILKQYADECQELPRSTTDTSPLEKWLIIQLLIKQTELDARN